MCRHLIRQDTALQQAVTLVQPWTTDVSAFVGCLQTPAIVLLVFCREPQASQTSYLARHHPLASCLSPFTMTTIPASRPCPIWTCAPGQAEPTGMCYLLGMITCSNFPVAAASATAGLHNEVPGDGLCCAWMAHALLPGMQQSIVLELCTEFVPVLMLLGKMAPLQTASVPVAFDTEMVVFFSSGGAQGGSS